MNTALIIAKEVVKAASNFGIGYMGGSVGQALTPYNARKIVKVCTYVGCWAASGAIAMKANDYIDETAELIDESIKSVKEAVKAKKSPEKTEEKEKNTVVEIIEDIEKKEAKPKKKETKKTKVEKTEEA